MREHVAPRHGHAAFALAAAALLLAAPLVAQREGVASERSRWSAIHDVFGQGEAHEGYYRINLPRSDLHVKIGDDALDSGFEFTSYIGFAPRGATDVMAMSEIIVVEREVPAVLAEARRQGIRVTAVHNHLLGESPRIMYVHAMAEGKPGAVAAEFKAVFARTATPLAPGPEEKPTGDWSAIDAVLGPHAEAHGRVAEYVFPRREHLTVHGLAVKSSGVLETASEVVFQRLSGNRVAVTGELYILAGEVDAVVRALDDHGLNITALHHHMVDDEPRMYWVHWYSTGDAATLARGVAAALAPMNSVRRSSPEPE